MRRFSSVPMTFTASVLLLTAWMAFPRPLLAQNANHGDPALRSQRQAKHQQEFIRAHSDSSGRLRPDLLAKGLADAKRLKIAAGVSLSGPPTRGAAAGAKKTNVRAAFGGVTGVQWTEIGPAPLVIEKEQNFQGTGTDSGQVLDIAIDPRNTTDNIIYIATNDGGIWKSTDGGTTWAPKTDYMQSLSMGAVALDPTNPSIVYAGTGDDFNDNGRNFRNIGIYRSIDGGDTWTVLGGSVFSGKNIIRIVVPAHDIVLVATTNGLYRSGNGGQNFGANSPLFNDGKAVLGGYISDLHVDTKTATTVYAAVDGKGIFQSTDSGATFPTNLFSNPGAPTSNFGFITFAQSTAPDGKTIYASVEDTSTATVPPATGYPFKGVYVSTDSGANWTQIFNASVQAAGNACQCNYDQTIGVDPKDVTRVYLGFQDLYVSTDAALTFTKVNTNAVHDDQHALVFSPATHPTGTATITQFYVGHDGGINRSNDGSGTWSSLNGAAGKSGALATNVIRSIDIGRGNSTNNVYTYGGAQDTGISQHRPGDTGADWHLFHDGDGGQVIVDPSDPMNAYSSDDGIFTQTHDGGSTWTDSVTPGSGLPDCGGRFKGKGCASPVAADPINSKFVYAASGTQLFQSTDMGSTFTSIHDFKPNSISTAASMIQIDADTMWVGLSDGSVSYSNSLSTGAASTWTSRTVTGAPAGQSVAGIVADPTNNSLVAVVYAGFCGNPCNIFASGNLTRHVFMTTDAGVTWNDIGGTSGGNQNLPDLPLHSVVIDPGTFPHTVIVAGDTGVLRSADSGATWQVFGVGLPTVDSVSLALDSTPTPSLLRLGTYGRSTFELTAASGPLLAVNANLAFGTVCFGDSNTLIVQFFNVGSSSLTISGFIPTAGSNPDFQIVSGPPTPVTILPGEEVDYTVQFKPSFGGIGTDETATFQINSNDPFQPTRLLSASGTVGAAKLASVIANAGDFGNVCLGSFADLPLTLNNAGTCGLSVSAINSTSGDFLPSSVLKFPLAIAAGNSLAAPIRFQPTKYGASSATITVLSNDPDLTNAGGIISVIGNAPPGNIKATGSTAFGDVCAGTLAEKTVNVCDFPTTGACNLNVASAVLTDSGGGACKDFTLPNNPFPSPVSANSCLNLTVRFTPTSAGPKSCNLTVTSDDKGVTNSKVVLLVTANTPLNLIGIAPDLGFSPTVIQSVGACRTAKPFVITNQGSCPLNVNSVAITTDATEFSLSGLPSLTTPLQPGHVLGEGNLNAVFAPILLSRNDDGKLTVTYDSDPVTHASASVTRNVCGEGDRTGARVLVTVGGIPISSVDKIQLVRATGNVNKPILNTVDNAMNLPLQTVTPAVAACAPFQYHREYGSVSNPIQLLPGSYRLTVTVTLNGKKVSQTVGFDTTTCTYNPNVVVKF